jgi:hypothetical protein
VKYSQAVVKSYMGEEITDEFKTAKKRKFIIRHCVMPDRNGVYEGIFIDPKIADKVIDILDLLKKGIIVENYLNTQIAIVFLEFDENDQILKNINRYIYPKILE